MPEESFGAIAVYHILQRLRRAGPAGGTVR
jgi:hypothetical protein